MFKAESWRSAAPDVRRDYEERAARINAAQARKQANYNSQQALANQAQMAQKAQAQAQPSPNRFNNASSSGLRISSVSSLSPQVGHSMHMV